MFSADDMRRAARLVDAMWQQPANKFAAQQAIEGGDAKGIARALAMTCVLFAGPAGYSQEQGAHEMQRMVTDTERREKRGRSKE